MVEFKVISGFQTHTWSGEVSWSCWATWTETSKCDTEGSTDNPTSQAYQWSTCRTVFAHGGMNFFRDVRSKPGVFQVERPKAWHHGLLLGTHGWSPTSPQLISTWSDKGLMLILRLFGRTMVTVWFSGGHVALRGGRNSVLWCRLCQTSWGMLGKSGSPLVSLSGVEEIFSSILEKEEVWLLCFIYTGLQCSYKLGGPCTNKGSRQHWIL